MTFAGGSTVGYLNAGTLRVGGDFNQFNLSLSNPQSFWADGVHVTEFAGTGPQTVFFQNPDTLESHFAILRTANNSVDGVTFASNASVYTQLENTVPNGALRRLAGNGLVRLTARGAAPDSLRFDGLALDLVEGAVPAGINYVRFDNQDPAATQLLVRGTGDGTALDFKGLTFTTTPAAGGLYLDLVDEDGLEPSQLTLTMTGTTPAAHNGFAQTQNGAALEGWPASLPAPVTFAGIDTQGASGLFDFGGVDSVETIITKNRAAASDAYVVEMIRQAVALFIAGGDQSNYVDLWKGTPVEDVIHELVARNVPIGGTSAGLAVMGEFLFSAANGTVYSDTALSNPYNRKVALDRDFLVLPYMNGIITDSHFVTRDRMGRLVTFLARIVQDDWGERA